MDRTLSDRTRCSLLTCLAFLLTGLIPNAQDMSRPQPPSANTPAAGSSTPSPQAPSAGRSERRAVAPASLFAHVVVGGGYRTVFSFVNTGASTLSGTLILTASDGTPMSVSLASVDSSAASVPRSASSEGVRSSLPVTIPPGGSGFVAASAADPSEPVRSGWARVESHGGSLGGVATFQSEDASGRVRSTAGVIAAEAVAAARIPIDDDRGGERFTGYAVANPGSEQLSISGTLLAESPGAPVNTFSLSLAPGRQLARFFFESMAVPERFKGSVSLQEQSGKKFAVVALLQHAGQYVALPVIPALPAARSLLALANGTVIDGTGADPLHNATVIIGDNRIEEVGPAGSVRIPADARVIDLQGATILPGFFNVHVHSAFSESNLRAWAQAGVTTVRDLGFQAEHMWWPMAFRDQRADLPQFARIVAVGVPISTPGGYPLEGGKTTVLTAASPDEARARVNLVLDHGADLIKASLDSGLIVYGRADLPVFGKEESSAIVEAAHRRGVPVSVHVTAMMDLAKAVDYGFDEIAHMVADDLGDEQLIGRMISNDTYWVPTLELWSFFQLAPRAVANLRRFTAAGGKVALGTDFSGAAKPFQLGMPLREMELMLQAGMTPMQIIVAATKHAAHVCNLERSLGTLERGKLADVLVVKSDPLKDIHALSQVRLVVHNGTIIRDAGN